MLKAGGLTSVCILNAAREVLCSWQRHVLFPELLWPGYRTRPFSSNPQPLHGLGSVTVPQVEKLELSLRCVTRETGIPNGITSALFCYILWPHPCKSTRGHHRAVSSRAGDSEGPICSHASAHNNQQQTLLGVSWSVTFYDSGSCAGYC